MLCTPWGLTWLWDGIQYVTLICKDLGQIDIFVRSSGQADLWSDGPPQAKTHCGQVCYYCSQVDLWSDIPHPPGQRHLVAMCHYFGQVDLWSDGPLIGEALGQVDIFVRFTP